MLAIVIPYYKKTFFEDTLQSLANQTDKRFKVYIGDDNSPENPKDSVEKYLGQFDFMYHRFENNLGGISLTQQWERCIALSEEEEWLMILGDDDCLGVNVVATWYSNLDVFCNKTNLIRFASKIIFEESNTVSEIFNHPLWESATESFFRKFEHKTRSSLSEYIFSRVAYRKYKFYDYPLGWNSDDQAWLDFSGSKPIFTINESVIFVRLSELNISGKMDNINLKNKSQILFYQYLIKVKLKFYDKSKRIKILRRYENEINLTRKLSFAEWIFLYVHYLKYLDFDHQKKVMKRFLNVILKRHE